MLFLTLAEIDNLVVSQCRVEGNLSHALRMSRNQSRKHYGGRSQKFLDHGGIVFVLFFCQTSRTRVNRSHNSCLRRCDLSVFRCSSLRLSDMLTIVIRLMLMKIKKFFTSVRTYNLILMFERERGHSSRFLLS